MLDDTINVPVPPAVDSSAETKPAHLPYPAAPTWAPARARYVGGVLAVSVALGLVTAHDPGWTLVAGVVGTLLAAVLIRPELAGYLIVGVTPLVAGINRGQGISILRPSETLALSLGCVLAAGLLLRQRTGSGQPLRVHPIEIAIVAMALANSVLPLLWMLLRSMPISQDDLLYALVMWKLLAIYVIVRLSITRREQVLRCLWISLVVGAAVAGVAILQSLGLFGVPKLLATYFAPFGDTSIVDNGRGSSTLGLAAAVADLMIYNLAVVAGLVVIVRRHRLWLGLLAILFIVGALSAGEFSSAIGLVVGVCFIAAAANRPRLLWMFVPVGGLTLLLLRPVIEKRLSGFESASGLPASWIGRIHNLQTYFWPKLFSGWNFVLGVQPGARVPEPKQATGYVWIESGYTWLLWGGGIPFLLAFLFLVRAGLRFGWRVARAGDGPVSVAALAVFVATGVQAVLMVFDPHLTYRGSAESYFALLAMAGVTWRTRDSGARSPGQPGGSAHHQHSWRTIMSGTNRNRLTVAVGAFWRRRTRGTPSFPHHDANLLRTSMLWIMLTTLVVTAAAAVYSYTRPALYTAHSDVLVQPRLFSNQSQPITPDMDTELAVGMSGAVQAIAAKSRGVSVDHVASGWQASVPANTHILRFSHTARDPSVAADFADAAAAAYVSYWQQRTPSSRDTRTGVITEASVPRSPSTPDHFLDLLAAVLVGLALGVGTAYVWDRTDDRLRSVRDLEDASGASVLGVIPGVKDPVAEPRSYLVLLTDPHGELARAYRELRARFLHVVMRHRGKVLLATSPSAADSAVVAANLAVSLTEAGHTVSLISVDVMDERLNELFDLPNEPGLVDVVRDSFRPGQALRATSVPGLSVLPAGSNRSDHGFLLVENAVPTVLGALALEADFVIVVAPPVLSAPDSGVLAEFVDLVLLVADAKCTTRRDVVEARRQLTMVESKVIGWVLQNVGRPQPARVPKAPQPTATVSGPAGQATVDQ